MSRSLNKRPPHKRLKSPPREFIRQECTRQRRLVDQREIQRCLKSGSWDDHQPATYRKRSYHSYW